MRKLTSALAALLAIAILVQPLRAQVAWDAPLLVSPATPSGWGIHLVDPWPGGGVGVLATWRDGSSTGFRLGVAEGWRGETAVYGGVDLSGRVARHSGEFPLDVDWVAGVGAGIGEGTLVSFPIGLTMGRLLRADGATFNPYLAPRLRVDGWIGTPRRHRGLRMNLGLDLGLDVGLTQGWSIRFGATMGDPDAVSIGIGTALPR